MISMRHIQNYLQPASSTFAYVLDFDQYDKYVGAHYMEMESIKLSADDPFGTSIEVIWALYFYQAGTDVQTETILLCLIW